jgi:hypothetical protein
MTNEYRGVLYYGELEYDSDFEVLYDNEEFDFTWFSRDTNEQVTWWEVIDFLLENYIEGDESIVEVSAV